MTLRQKTKMLTGRDLVYAEKRWFFTGLDAFSQAEGLERKTMNVPKNQIDFFKALKELLKPYCTEQKRISGHLKIAKQETEKAEDLFV